MKKKSPIEGCNYNLAGNLSALILLNVFGVQ